MNKKIKRYLEEIEKTEKKIADLQQYLKGIKSALKEEENNEMIRAIRGMKLEGKDLLQFLDGLKDGNVRFEVGKKTDGSGKGSFVRQDSNTEREDENDEKEMQQQHLPMLLLRKGRRQHRNSLLRPGKTVRRKMSRQMRQLRHLRQNRCWRKTGTEVRHLPLPETHRCRMILQKMEVRSS